MDQAVASGSRFCDNKKAAGVIFKLNTLLSTERFEAREFDHRNHLKSASEDWIATSPACDMVTHKPAARQAWASIMHPHQHRNRRATYAARRSGHSSASGT
jgi:hypothetical protein